MSVHRGTKAQISNYNHVVRQDADSVCRLKMFSSLYQWLLFILNRYAFKRECKHCHSNDKE